MTVLRRAKTAKAQNRSILFDGNASVDRPSLRLLTFFAVLAGEPGLRAGLVGEQF